MAAKGVCRELPAGGNGGMNSFAKPAPQQVRVFVATENRLMRESLGRVLGKRDSVSVIGTAPLSADVQQLARASAAEIVVVDGLDPLAQRVVEQCTHQAGMRVVVIGIQDNGESLLRIIRAGAAGLILQEADVNELIASIHAVAAREAVCSRKLVSSLFQQISQQYESGPQLELRPGLTLSRRERQLLPLVARGLTNKEIAGSLYVSEQTVKNHMHNILRKTGAKNRLSAVERCRIDALPA